MFNHQNLDDIRTRNVICIKNGNPIFVGVNLPTFSLGKCCF